MQPDSYRGLVCNYEIKTFPLPAESGQTSPGFRSLGWFLISEDKNQNTKADIKLFNDGYTQRPHLHFWYQHELISIKIRIPLRTTMALDYCQS